MVGVLFQIKVGRRCHHKMHAFVGDLLKRPSISHLEVMTSRDLAHSTLDGPECNGVFRQPWNGSLGEWRQSRAWQVLLGEDMQNIRMTLLRHSLLPGTP